jgi:hypothetical protein
MGTATQYRVRSTCSITYQRLWSRDANFDCSASEVGGGDSIRSRAMFVWLLHHVVQLIAWAITGCLRLVFRCFTMLLSHRFPTASSRSGALHVALAAHPGAVRVAPLQAPPRTAAAVACVSARYRPRGARDRARVHAAFTDQNHAHYDAASAGAAALRSNPAPNDIAGNRGWDGASPKRSCILHAGPEFGATEGALGAGTAGHGGRVASQWSANGSGVPVCLVLDAGSIWTDDQFDFVTKWLQNGDDIEAYPWLGDNFDPETCALTGSALRQRMGRPRTLSSPSFTRRHEKPSWTHARSRACAL